MNDFTERMRAIADGPRSPEEQHIQADDLMVAFLRHLGYDEAMDAFEGMSRWYS